MHQPACYCNENMKINPMHDGAVPRTPVKAAPLWFFGDISSWTDYHCDHSHLCLL